MLRPNGRLPPSVELDPSFDSFNNLIAMQTAEQKISTAQWMLERQLQWVAQAEVKVGALITLDVGMLGGLAAAHATTKVHSQWAVCCLRLRWPA